MDIPTTPFLLFTGKGGVGKTSLACATAVALADAGKKTLIVSTDPASNLDEVLGTNLTGEPTQLSDVANLWAMNIDPEASAAAYRERAIAPYRGILPDAAIRSIEEGLSGACTTEIAAFDEFTRLLSGGLNQKFDHIVFDTAPTGHTLRLLSLPAAWTGFLDNNSGGVSCLGPVSALQTQRSAYEASVNALKDSVRTTVMLVTRPERACIDEAARASQELLHLGIDNQRLILNGMVMDSEGDEIAEQVKARQTESLSLMPAELRQLQQSSVELKPYALTGIEGLRLLLSSDPVQLLNAVPHRKTVCTYQLDDLVEQLCSDGPCVIMTMGKGGVGKTTLAAAIAERIAQKGRIVLLTTTDPAAHVAAAARHINGLTIDRIDPAQEVSRYTELVLKEADRNLDAEGRALLEEDLRSPCTEEIAVFRAFAETVAKGSDGYVVIDTAPTGHTLLLLDAAEAYHREVGRTSGDVPDSVRQLLPRLRDNRFTKVVVMALAESTPVHEAKALAADLKRAGIEPFATVVNQCLSLSSTQHTVLSARAELETGPLEEATLISPRFFAFPWSTTAFETREAALAA